MYHSFLIHSSADGHLGCFHVLAIYKQCCDEHWGTCVSFNSGFLGVYAQKWDCWVIRQFYFQFFKESPHCSPQWLYQFAFPPTVQQGSLFSPPSPAFIACRFLDRSHSDWCEVVLTGSLLSTFKHLMFLLSQNTKTNNLLRFDVSFLLAFREFLMT